jgi:hypothetical protein
MLFVIWKLLPSREGREGRSAQKPTESTSVKRSAKVKGELSVIQRKLPL